MRFAIGIGGLVVTLAVIVWIMSAVSIPHTQEVLTQRKTMTQQVERIAGRGVAQSITFDGVNSGSRLESLKVADVDPMGPMAKWGLRTGDLVIEINGQRVRDINDTELAKALAQEAYQRGQTVVVLRDGQSINIPGGQPVNTNVPPVARQTPAPQESQPSSPPPGKGNPLQRQLDAIQRIPGQ